MRVLDPVFGHPRGPAGRLGGALMACSNAELVSDAEKAGFSDVKLSRRARQLNSAAVELFARRPDDR